MPGKRSPREGSGDIQEGTDDCAGSAGPPTGNRRILDGKDQEVASRGRKLEHYEEVEPKNAMGGRCHEISRPQEFVGQVAPH